MKPALTKTDILETLRRRRPDLERFSVKTIALFGSYARDAQTDASDLDFVVEGIGNRHCALLCSGSSARP